MDAQTQFFRALARSAGRVLPDHTVDSVVRPAAPTDPAELAAHLGTRCNRLGLDVAPVRVALDEAIAMVGSDRPVLLVVRRESGDDLIAMSTEDGPTVRAGVLSGGSYRELSLPRARVAEELALADAPLVAAFRVQAMGRVHVEIPPSFVDHPLRRLWHFLTPDRTEILIVVGFAIGLGVLALATPIAVQSLVNFVAFGGLMQPLIVVGLLLLFTLAFAGTIRVFKFYVVEILQRRVFVRVVSDLAARLPRVRVDVYDRGHGPELVNRFFDVLTIQKSGSALLIDGLDIVLQTGIGLLVLGFYHPLLLVFDVLLIASIAFILLGLGRGAVMTARKESYAKYEVAGALEELARAPVAYKLAGAQGFASARLAELAGDYVAARRKHYGVVFRQLVGAVTLHAAAGTALLTLGGFLVIQGQLTLGQLVAAELIVSAALASFVKFGKQLEEFYDLLAGVDKLGILFDLPLEQDVGESQAPGPAGAALELRRVSYRYPGQATGVRDVSLRIEPNQRVAVRGPRRSGKSTLADLVSGMREPDSGVVLFDGVDLRDVAKVSIRSQEYLVRGFEIIEASIVDNVRVGRAEVSMDRVRDALACLGILAELHELPEGLRTEIACSGSPLSRSTALLLILARAIVGQPRAIIIDGVLDELDRTSLSHALTALTSPDAPWTLLVFTSRDEVCDAMERVVDLEPGPPAGRPTAIEQPVGGNL